MNSATESQRMQILVWLIWAIARLVFLLWPGQPLKHQPHRYDQSSNGPEEVGVGAGTARAGDSERPASRSEAGLYRGEQLEDDGQAAPDLPLALLLQLGLSIPGSKARSSPPGRDAPGA
jgi:hypothetical protein